MFAQLISIIEESQVRVCLRTRVVFVNDKKTKKSHSKKLMTTYEPKNRYTIFRSLPHFNLIFLFYLRLKRSNEITRYYLFFLCSQAQELVNGEVMGPCSVFFFAFVFDVIYL